MNGKLELTPLALDGFEISVVDGIVLMTGVISLRNPSETVTPYLKKIHTAAVQASVKVLVVDLTRLKFMNSSSIRSLVDWVEWIRHEPPSMRYGVQFVTNKDLGWQSTTMSAIQCFGGEIVTVKTAA